MDKKISGRQKAEYLKNFIFGVEDSLVSTVGLISGVAVGGLPKTYIILTGVVLVFVEAFSMAVGSLLSENSAEEFEGKREVALSKDLGYALVMLVSYLLSGFLIIAPYLFLEGHEALWTSITFALVALFSLGFWSGKVSGVTPIRRGFVMFLVGGSAIFLGVLVGLLLG